MTVKKFLQKYVNTIGAGYGVYTKKNHLRIYHRNQKEKVIKDFGNKTIQYFEIENESTIGLLIYLKEDD